MPDTELIHGIPADYWNASKVHILIACSVFLIVFTIFTISLRFYARISSRAPLWWDDKQPHGKNALTSCASHLLC
jgi:hypothetical protein